MAVHRYFMPLQDSWHQTGVLAASVLAPHRGNGKPAKPADFVHRYFMPLQDSWHQTGVLAASVLAPHRGNGKPAKPADFVPIEQPPQHPVQREETLRELYQQLRGE